MWTFYTNLYTSYNFPRERILKKGIVLLFIIEGIFMFRGAKFNVGPQCSAKW